MKKIYTIILLVIALTTCVSLPTRAQWTQVLNQPYTHALYMTKDGVLLTADYTFEFTGGISYSTDLGETWHKSSVKDFNYYRFYEHGEYVYALGVGCRIARSKNGKKWDLLNYSSVVSDYLSKIAQQSTVCYAVAAHKGRLYFADLNASLVFYTEDDGKTWQPTDRSGFFMGKEVNDKDTTDIYDNPYELYSFNGNLYCMGCYNIYRFDEKTSKWVVDYRNTNFMCVQTQHNGVLIGAHTIEDYGRERPFLEQTEDGKEWDWVVRPKTIMNNYVRALASDGTYLYAGTIASGVLATPDMGFHWYDMSEGIPTFTNSRGTTEYLTPIWIVPTEKYIFMALFDAATVASKSGVYRVEREWLDKLTGIEQVKASRPDAPAYDLSGRRVRQGSKGFYIQNGKKYLR